MNATTEQIFDAALQLTTGDRAVLVDALLASLCDEGEPPFDESWRAVIEWRPVLAKVPSADRIFIGVGQSAK